MRRALPLLRPARPAPALCHDAGTLPSDQPPTPPPADVDAVVVGAGVVGLATARALAGRGRDVLLLDAGPDFGTGVSSRSSEVVHAGEGEGVVE